jgi:hypothetical protein
MPNKSKIPNSNVQNSLEFSNFENWNLFGICDLGFGI